MLESWRARHALLLGRLVAAASLLFGETGWLGPYFNVLPIITIGLFLVQQKMFMPPATDEQSAMQQKIMTYMMIFMGLLFYKVASGLCLYFIASSLWGIGERKLLPKLIGSPSKPPPTGGNVSGASSSPQRRRKRRRATWSAAEKTSRAEVTAYRPNGAATQHVSSR